MSYVAISNILSLSCLKGNNNLNFVFIILLGFHKRLFYICILKQYSLMIYMDLDLVYFRNLKNDTVLYEFLSDLLVFPPNIMFMRFVCDFACSWFSLLYSIYNLVCICHNLSILLFLVFSNC